jgi:hypothetical protein
MKLHRKKTLVYAERITMENLENLKAMGARVHPYNERSMDSFCEHGCVGDTVIWTCYDQTTMTLNGKIYLAQCKTIEGLHTAELPSRLMKPSTGGHPYFCTEEVYQQTYEEVDGEPNDKRSAATTDAQREETTLQKNNVGGDEVAEKQEEGKKTKIVVGDWFENEHGAEVTVIAVSDEWCMVTEVQKKKPYVLHTDFLLAIFNA